MEGKRNYQHDKLCLSLNSLIDTPITPMNSLCSSLHSMQLSLHHINKTESLQSIEEVRQTQKNDKKMSSCLNYVMYIVISIGCAIAVMIIWYLTRHQEIEEENQIVNQDHNQTTDLNTCPFWEIAGDGYCDDEANIAECGYDFRDCCQMHNDRTLCEDCFCYIMNATDETSNLMCNDYLPDLGDKFCDLSLNNVKNYFDVGDCCLPDTYCLIEDTISHVPCPEMVCIQSNIFCVPEELGDGVCQDYNNGPYCNYDFGDCCLVPGNLTECCHCVCHGNSLDLT